MTLGKGKCLDNMEATLLWKDIPIIDFYIQNGELIYLNEHKQNKAHYPLQFAFREVNLLTLYAFIDARILPETRQNINDLLADMGLSHYEWDGIIKANHGLSTDDCYWFRRKDETLTYSNLNWRD